MKSGATTIPMQMREKYFDVIDVSVLAADH
jgi:hypothetical protein